MMMTTYDNVDDNKNEDMEPRIESEEWMILTNDYAAVKLIKLDAYVVLYNYI